MLYVCVGDVMDVVFSVRSEAVTVVWQTLCILCLPLPPPAMVAR